MSDDRFSDHLDPHDEAEPVGATAMSTGFVSDSVWRRWWSTASVDQRGHVAAGKLTLTVPADDGTVQQVAVSAPRWLCDELAD